MLGYLTLLKPRIGLMVTLSAVAGALAAGPQPPARTLALLALATALASAGASALNHYWDRDLDALMERTRDRPLPAGSIRPPRALLLGLGLSAGGVGLGLSVNSAVSLYLALGALVYVVLYTIWLKRRSPWNIVVGGLAGSFAVLAGAGAVKPDLAPTAASLALAATLFLWTPPHFWSLAIASAEDYRRAGIPMLPVVMGQRVAARRILVSTILLVAASVLLHRVGGLGPVYLLGAVAAGALFLARNLQLLFRPSPQRSRRSFRASLLYLGLLLLALIADVALPLAPGASGTSPLAVAGVGRPPEP